MLKIPGRAALAALLFSSVALSGPSALAQALDPGTQTFIDALAGAKPVYTLPIADARNVLAGAQKSVAVKLAPATVQDRVLNLGPTGRTRVRVYRPIGARGALPVVIYTHGGGWVLGDKNTHERLVRELTAGAKVISVFVDYERSPEARYPVAIEQVYATLDYVARHPAEFGADKGRIAIAGDSVGGNMTAVIALLAKERKGPALSAQLLFYPVTDASMSSQSYKDFAQGPWLTKAGMEWFWDQYLPDASKRADVHVSPINATSDQLRGLPRTLLIVNENDVLRDEGELHGRKLAAAGVNVTSVRYNGTIHDFMMLNAIAGTPAARGAVAQSIDYLKATLAR
jgi:acetyl esterase